MRIRALLLLEIHQIHVRLIDESAYRPVGIQNLETLQVFTFSQTFWTCHKELGKKKLLYHRASSFIFRINSATVCLCVEQVPTEVVCGVSGT